VGVVGFADEQTESIPSQRTEFTKYAQTHASKIVREHVDEGISGDATQRRTEFLAMRDNAESGKSSLLNNNRSFVDEIWQT
jgi:hypothetical protein